MHAGAFRYVAKCVQRLPERRAVLEYGGRFINGTIRDLFGTDNYVSIDIVPGPGVDVVANAVSYKPQKPVDTVVCCEVLEHSDEWPMIVNAAGRVLGKDGVAIFTCATNGRLPHSAVDGGAIRDGEYYGNVDPLEMTSILDKSFAQYELEIDSVAGDLYAIAWKSEQ